MEHDVRLHLLADEVAKLIGEKANAAARQYKLDSKGLSHIFLDEFKAALDAKLEEKPKRVVRRRKKRSDAGKPRSKKKRAAKKRTTKKKAASKKKATSKKKVAASTDSTAS